MIYTTEAKAYQTQDGMQYTGYDLVAREAGQTELRIQDVTEDARFARLLCAALNREQAEPIHLTDILSDLLADSGLREALLSPPCREEDAPSSA